VRCFELVDRLFSAKRFGVEGKKEQTKYIVKGQVY